jgi:hypothetical protein
MVEIKKILFPCDLTENSSKILRYVLVQDPALRPISL